jgi:peptide/nickel transport system substrate-binding protein
MTIRTGVRFSDGSRLTPEVVRDNLLRAKTVVGFKTDQLSGMTSVTVSGNTVNLHLKSPDPALPLDLSQVLGMMVSPRALANPRLLAKGPVGAGPYVVDTAETVPHTTYTFTRNRFYWDPKAFPYNEVVMKVITDPAAALNAVRSGQVAMTWGSAPNVAAAKSSGLTVLSEPGDFNGLWINDIAGRHVPALKSRLVRQAMLLAINRPAVVKVVGTGTPAAEIFPKGTTGYDPTLDTKYLQPHIAEAKKLLAEAGYPEGFTLPVLSISAFDQEASVVAADLGAIGIKTALNDIPLAEFASSIHTAPVFYSSYAPIDTYYDARALLLPTGGFNFTHKSDPKLNALISDYAHAQTRARQAMIGKQIGARVTYLGWFTVAYITANLQFVSKTVRAEQTPFEAAVALWNIKPAS